MSRWETGSNMPDLDILVEMADFYDVDLREILDGERKSEKMDEELKETVLKVAEYSNEEKKRITRFVLVCFVMGIVALVINTIMALMDLEDPFWVGVGEGATIGMALVAMIFGILHATGNLSKVFATEKRLQEKE